MRVTPPTTEYAREVAEAALSSGDEATAETMATAVLDLLGDMQEETGRSDIETAHRALLLAYRAFSIVVAGALAEDTAALDRSGRDEYERAGLALAVAPFGVYVLDADRETPSAGQV